MQVFPTINFVIDGEASSHPYFSQGVVGRHRWVARWARSRCVESAQRLRNRVASVVTDGDGPEILAVVNGGGKWLMYDGGHYFKKMH